MVFHGIKVVGFGGKAHGMYSVISLCFKGGRGKSDCSRSLSSFSENGLNSWLLGSSQGGGSCYLSGKPAGKWKVKSSQVSVSVWVCMCAEPLENYSSKIYIRTSPTFFKEDKTWFHSLHETFTLKMLYLYLWLDPGASDYCVFQENPNLDFIFKVFSSISQSLATCWSQVYQNSGENWLSL